MKSIESNIISDIVFEKSLFVLFLDGIEVIKRPVPIPNFSSDDLFDLETHDSYTFEHNSIKYLLSLKSSFEGLKYELFSTTESPVKIAISIEETIIDPENINVYVPSIKYTDYSIVIVKEVLEVANKKVVPLIDIREEDTIPTYASEFSEIEHFLDLCRLREVANADEREKVKAIQDEYKRLKRKGKPKLPTKDYQPIDQEDIIDVYIDLAKKISFIPVYGININGLPHETYQAEVNALERHFDKILVRIHDHKYIEHYFSDYFDVWNKEKIIVMVEFTGDNATREKTVLNEILTLGVDIIYAKETTDYASNTIKTNHYNFMPNTSLTSYYSRLHDTNKELWYSDYCGYDRDTIISWEPYYKPTARLFLLDINDGKELLILKINHPAEKNTHATKQSFEQLQEIIDARKIDPRFLLDSHCTACYFVLHDNKLSLKTAKKNCMLHNVVVIATI